MPRFLTIGYGDEAGYRHFYKLTALGLELESTFRALGQCGTSYLQSRQTRA